VVSLEEADETRYDLGFGDDSGDAGPGGFAAFTASRYGRERPRLIEAPFELLIANASISGRIDAVYEPEPGLWEVVDFKSGRRRDHSALETQLEAYALAVREAGLAPEPPERIRVAFVYLGGGLEVAATDVDDAWLARARMHVSHLAAAAGGGRYQPEPSRACRTCDFAGFCESGRRWLAAEDREES
jgi:RecB family exonuclease